MKIEEMVRKYRMKIAQDGIRLLVYGVEEAKHDNVLDEIKTRKEEIVSFLRVKKEEKERDEKEREEKINSIKGLKEIRSAIEEQNKWTIKFEKKMSSEDGFTGMREKPGNHIDELLKKYPRAAAYIRAYNLSIKANYELSKIGSDALDKIVNGEDYTAAIYEMEQRKKEFTERHIWD